MNTKNSGSAGEAAAQGNGAAKDPGQELAAFAKDQQEKKAAAADGAKQERKAADAKLGGSKKKAAKKPAGKKSKKASAKKPAGKKPKKAAAKKPAGKKGGGAKARGIGSFCEGLLKQKKSTDEIVKAVKAKFPDAKTSPASIAWYRSKMREEGTLPKA